MTDYDSELIGYNAVLRRAWAIRPGDRVLDIGCGAGGTTREAARLAPAGSALGVDVSAPAIERARLAPGPPNVAYECADAQTYGFTPGSFDVAVSRFGTMFFAAPVAAFANVARALTPAGRLVMLVWQAHDRNEWSVALAETLDARVDADGPDPFSLADPATVRATLEAAGFAAIELTDVGEPLCFGADVDAAEAWVRGFTCTSAALERLAPAAREAALARLRDLLAAHLRDDGVWFDARAWLVTARRR
ncbi:class I SAM-dependent methyltransferase [Actinoplanes sp. URMC 104]|uniref:class I SAM-dependent methyltransferase n=1 Tax=Actinoplanes sp. URMC 104 TaxID=3423409 RepID=UPI003F1CA510